LDENTPLWCIYQFEIENIAAHICWRLIGLIASFVVVVVVVIIVLAFVVVAHVHIL
jgi:hypothetical protein